MKKTKKIFLLGASGSIGKNTIDCIQYLNASEETPFFYELVGVSVYSNTKFIEEIQNQFSLKTVAISDKNSFHQFQNKDNEIQIFDDLVKAIEETEFDLLVNAVVGSAGLEPTVTALKKKCDVALANKETLVIAGKLINDLVVENNCSLLPIDSEHSALFFLLENFVGKNNDSGNDFSKKNNLINRVIITASGGPFWNSEIKSPTVEQALKHPSWKMGSKITIDSATMMNKGFEVIEAHYFFDLPFEKIETIIHPQSLIHSIIETKDGEQYAQIGSNDMRHPIQNALTYPFLCENKLKKFNLWEHEKLTFYPPNHKKFPLLELAYQIGKKGQLYCTVMNAANEVAVDSFLKKKIAFEEIYKMILEEINEFEKKSLVEETLENILTIDKEIKQRIGE